MSKDIRNCKHPTEFLSYKCMCCCTVATWYCGATNFYCDRCHDDLHTIYPCLGDSHAQSYIHTHVHTHNHTHSPIRSQSYPS